MILVGYVDNGGGYSCVRQWLHGNFCIFSFFAMNLKLPFKKKEKEKNTCSKIRNIWNPKVSPLLFSNLSQVVTFLRLHTIASVKRIHSLS